MKVRALLACGLVLGVGAAVTYASWVDQEDTTATITASQFNTESSVDNGTSYADNPTSPGATLALNAGGISPTVVVAAAIAIRTKANSVAGTAALGTPTIVDTPGTVPLLSASLQYRVYRDSTNSCTTTSIPVSGAWVVGGAGPTGWVTLPTAVTANSSPLAAATAAAGAPTWFCFQVTLPSGADNTLQGRGATATWRFTTTSNQ